MRTRPEYPFPYNFTIRELQVVQLLIGGLQNKEIAARLAISPRTVKNHVTNICGKLGVQNRTEVAIYMLRREKEWKTEWMSEV